MSFLALRYFLSRLLHSVRSCFSMSMHCPCEHSNMSYNTTHTTTCPTTPHIPQHVLQHHKYHNMSYYTTHTTTYPATPHIPQHVLKHYTYHKMSFNNTNSYNTTHHTIGWLVVCLTTRQHRKVNLCQMRGRETGSVG